MKRRIFLAGALAGLPAIAIAADKKKEKTLQQRLEGKWVRPNHPYSIEVKGNEWFHYEQAQPFKPTSTGVIEYPRGKDYAIVKTDNGFVWWLFSAGEDALAAEHFRQDGRLDNGSDGRLFYRQGTHTP